MRPMYDSPSALLEAVRLGPSSFLDLVESHKPDEHDLPELADRLAALANTRGGALLFGVEPRTREVVGIPDSNLDALTRLVQASVDLVEPPIKPLLSRPRLPNGTGDQVSVLKVGVLRSLFLHRSPAGYVHRLGNATRPMSDEYRTRLLQQRSGTGYRGFDLSPVLDAAFADLALPRIERLPLPSHDDEPATLARKLGLLVKPEDEERHPTITGVLVATQEPQRWLRHAYIQAVAYRGTDVPTSVRSEWYQVDAQDIDGPVDEQIANACRFVARNQKVRARKSLGREDQPQYDMGAVFEAIVNAVAHRDYSMQGSRIRLHMFSDRIELYSPGDIANSMAVEDLAYRQSSRNETLTSMLARCPVPERISCLETPRTTMMDRRGNGVPLILERSERLSGRKPEYRLIGNAELLLTIYAAHSET